MDKILTDHGRERVIRGCKVGALLIIASIAYTILVQGGLCPSAGFGVGWWAGYVSRGLWE